MVLQSILLITSIFLSLSCATLLYYNYNLGFHLLLSLKSVFSPFLLRVQRFFCLYYKYNRVLLIILFAPQEDIRFISLVKPLSIIVPISILFMISYYLLYKKLDIPKSGSSFAFYSLNILILLSYLFSFYILCTKDVKGYVSLEDLPVTTSYRYTLLFLLALIGIFLYLVSFYNSRINDFLTLFKYPYLREELRMILKGGFEGPLGTLCIKIIEYIFKYKIFKYAFFTIHFLFLYIYRLILALVFIWCCFFEGNFIYFLLLSPLSFIVWLLSCFNYYLTSFLQANTNYTKDILIVKMIKEDLLQEDSRFIRTSLNDLSFQLSSFGKEEGFTEKDLASLRDSWAELVSVSATFSKYSFLQKNVSLFIFLLYLLCWAYISSLLVKESFFGWFSLFRTTTSKVSKIENNSLAYLARDSRYPKEKIMHDLRNHSGGKYSPGHPIYGEEVEGGKYRVDGSFTKGNPKEQKTIPTLPHSIDGKTNRPQNRIPMDKPFEIDVNDLNPPIQGSEATLKPLKETLDNDHKKDT